MNKIRTEYESGYLAVVPPQYFKMRLAVKYPFLKPAIQANIDQIPTTDNPDRPVQSLMNIINELKTNEFGPVFRLFCQRESIYGFGDLQVKRIFEEINKI
jgi:hypothetical protein